MDSLKVFADRGYVVKETGPVYYTQDMDETAKWFEEILGWYYEIDERDADGKGVYGCVYNIPKEVEILHIAPFTGIHMFCGESKGGVAAFMQVQGIEALYKYVKAKKYKDISEIQMQPWGAKMCTINTPDGYALRFFE
ncbi:VOC family protein [Sedimentibacter hydroxybenzoicus DSM 7310]|uniref:VOC family protein n=1 Tax=Sedimentibacter hydroxybenzoicus DSM 7310 TaxID=1123245 RepID=A0A974BJC1_SEDHY|nr:VOC family protein [Sedimentibacter hydroxybenzoicus]NYB74324.1 VOC family protein [Sedimentibacter hydroxybenzoicus DSM 7310]